MNTVLLGNGINIQFGGNAYNSDFILKRIKFKSFMDDNLCLFNNLITGKEILEILDEFTKIANAIINNEYDTYINDKDTQIALDDFKIRYDCYIRAPHEIMLEDWFFLIHLFFLRHSDLTSKKTSTIQGFEHLILDSIYNEGNIQELYTKMNAQVKSFFSSFDNVFTLNYDNNIEKAIHKNVYHLHGDFSVLANSENPNILQGFLRTTNDETVVIKGMEHCFCNALLNYSGHLKYKHACDSHSFIVARAAYIEKLNNDVNFKKELSEYKSKNCIDYESIMQTLEHPELNIATEYHFNDFEKIEGELHIIGMSANNDTHIFDLILENTKLTKVIFYYFKEKDKDYIKKNYSEKLFLCESVESLWIKLGCNKVNHFYKYNIPKEIDNFIEIVNSCSYDIKTKKEILKELSNISQAQMNNLCKLVKADLLHRNPDHLSTSKADLDKQLASISFIALQEGISPSTLYLIYIMNRTK